MQHEWDCSDNFGIDTVLVLGTPVWIHPRISEYGDLHGKEGMCKRSAGRREGVIKGGRREGEREPGKGPEGG